MRFPVVAGLAAAALLAVSLTKKHEAPAPVAAPAPIAAPVAEQAPVPAPPVPPLVWSPVAPPAGSLDAATPAPALVPVPLPRPKPRARPRRVRAERFPKQPPAPEPGCILLKCLPLFRGGQ